MPLDVSVFVVKNGRARPDGDHITIGFLDRRLLAYPRLTRPKPPREYSLNVFFPEDSVDILTDHPLPIVPEDILGRRVEIEDLSAIIDGDQPVLDDLDDTLGKTTQILEGFRKFFRLVG